MTTVVLRERGAGFVTGTFLRPFVAWCADRFVFGAAFVSPRARLVAAVGLDVLMARLRVA